MLFAIDKSIRKLQPYNNPPIYEDAVIAGKRIKSLDVDAIHRLVYWTDSVEKKIYRFVFFVWFDKIFHPSKQQNLVICTEFLVAQI